MAVVRFCGTDRSIEVSAGTTILQAARQAGIVIEAPCNSAGSCGKCAVQLEPASLGNILHKGRHRLSPEAEARGFVLSCEAEIQGDIAVARVPREEHGTLQIISHGVGCAVGLEPFIGKEFDGRANLTRVLGGGQELALEAGDTRQALYGVVVDIGTTTLAASLLDLSTGQEISCAGALNPQSHHAQDILSRIRFAATGEGLQTMHAAVIEEIGRLIGSLAREAAIDPENVYEIVFSGNTCMLHLAIRENPASLGKFPYSSRLAGGEQRPASGLGLPVASCALIYLPPVISAYVGPDITSGILATGLQNGRGTTLLVDIGTNGEMVLACNGRLFATSTAAGPAFEGMNIGCGMRASNGAIEGFSIDARGELSVQTIGEVEAIGICGSGLMDIAAELVACGVIAADGRFCSPESPELPGTLQERLVRQDGKTSFRITEKVSISQKDIRQVQLAKGAVRAGIEFLLREVGIGADSVERVLIAGSFGYHLRVESLLTIGLLPPQFAGKVEFVGNTSKSGGEAFLLNRTTRQEMAAVVAGIEVLELANLPDFDRCFVRCLSFSEPG
ncbi:MAG: DUF4445 domain-containing protein [Steroidobacteraceae bacterium]|nr:DUF4445 domain-containing protein [Deltaproteobacteria bacterium]